MAKPFAVLLLLLGIWGAELTLFGFWWAGLLAIAMWVGCAAVLVATRAPSPMPERSSARRTTARGAHVLG